MRNCSYRRERTHQHSGQNRRYSSGAAPLTLSFLRKRLRCSYFVVRDTSGGHPTIELKMIQSPKRQGVQVMKCFAVVLTALTAVTVAIAPASYAAPDFDELRRENLDKDAVIEVSLRGEDLDELRRRNLDKDAVNFDELRRENLEKDAIA